MSNGYSRDPTTGLYRLVMRHGRPGVILRNQPLRTWERIQAEDRCPGCGHVYKDCHCAPPLAPDQLGQVLEVQRQRPGPAPAPHKPVQASAPPRRAGRTFQNAAHALLACQGCGYITCRCGVPAPPDTTGDAAKLRAQRRTP